MMSLKSGLDSNQDERLAGISSSHIYNLRKSADGGAARLIDLAALLHCG